jgi:putative flippase GtrA
MIQRITAFAKREWRVVTKFLIVGGVSFVAYLLPYTLLSRVFFPEGNRVFMNLIATCISVIFNYLAQSTWTYRVQGHSIGQLGRYGFVLASVTALQSLLFWVGTVELGVYDYAVIVVVAGICACYTFLMHRYFTFRSRVTHSA